MVVRSAGVHCPAKISHRRKESAWSGVGGGCWRAEREEAGRLRCAPARLIMILSAYLHIYINKLVACSWTVTNGDNISMASLHWYWSSLLRSECFPNYKWSSSHSPRLEDSRCSNNNKKRLKKHLVTKEFLGQIKLNWIDSEVTGESTSGGKTETGRLLTSSGPFVNYTFTWAVQTAKSWLSLLPPSPYSNNYTFYH